jgi:hypothetical protein
MSRAGPSNDEPHAHGAASCRWRDPAALRDGRATRLYSNIALRRAAALIKMEEHRYSRP